MVSTDAEEDEASSSLAETRRVTPRDAMGEARGDTRAWRGADRAGARRAPECAMTRAATGAVMHIISREVRREVCNGVVVRVPSATWLRKSRPEIRRKDFFEFCSAF